MVIAEPESGNRPFTMSGVGLRMILVLILASLDGACQAVWVVASHNTAWNVWWLGIFGITEDMWSLWSVVVALLVVSSGFGAVILFFSMIFDKHRWLFVLAMVMLFGGIARIIGTMLGRTILYERVRRGMIPDGTFITASGRGGSIEMTDTLHSTWPYAVFAMIVAIAVLCFSLRESQKGSRAGIIEIGSGLLISMGILGVALVSHGFDFYLPVFIIAVLYMSFAWLPNEMRTARICERQRVGSQWEWHAASFLLLGLTVIAMSIFTILTGA